GPSGPASVQWRCERPCLYPRVDAFRGTCIEDRSSCHRCKSHLEVEGEPSTILQSLQGVCENCRMLRTYVRIGREPKVRLAPLRRAERSATILSMSRTVLIVDDHPSFRASARAMLESEGFVVVGEAEDGADALDAVDRLSPDIIVLDVQLPDMTGFDVCAALAARNGERPEIILVSSRDASDYGELVAASCACGFVPKGELSGELVASLL